MSVVEPVENVAISDGLTKLSEVRSKLSGVNEKQVRQELVTQLSEELTIHEAASLVAMVHERTSQIGKGKRFGLFPIEDWKAFTRSKELEASTWHADEIEFTDDRNDFNQLTPEEQKPLIRAFGFFAVGDGSVASMLAYRMILTAPTFEKQQFYVVQLDNERVHGETYSLMIHTLIQDPKEREAIFDAVENVESIREMNELIESSFTQPDGERELYITLAATEYLMFTPLFCIIFWYRNFKRGMLKNCLFSNEQIAKDEAAHCINGCENYLSLNENEQYTDEEVWKIIDKFVQAVSKFSEETLEDINLEDLTPANVKQYIRFVADDLLDRLNHKPLYNVSSPFPWMDFTNLIPKTNFYEGTVGEYSRFNPQTSVLNAQKLINGEVEEKVNVYQNARNMKF